ncbi:hypothetical protein [Corynebacterium pelargi]|uniref:Uncharacterized protein n=1 Tax=Corynebacterium pelargi TaxID=1471400 RepID=A0A410WBX1_9CORY|nr:hypothetical protein [Corynebacterium pelargi]QAU53446.1 hypothetical protein CPELA_11020 [Corynebacterium pelargi]GGG81967.1 hypothetical protein GCM10007338_20980 [Corynebacterium pelargi]
MLYVRTTFTIPGVGQSIHIAELEPIGPHTCRMHRMIELDPQGVIRGSVHGTQIKGEATPPMQEVPHPDTYEQYDGIQAEHLDAASFQALWAEAEAKLGS